MSSGELLAGKPKHRNPTIADIARARYKLLKGRLRTKKVLSIHKYLDKEMLKAIRIHNEYLLKILRQLDGENKT